MPNETFSQYLESLPEEKREKFVRQLKVDNEGTQYAAMIRQYVDDIETDFVSQIKNINGAPGSESAALILTGRLQAVEILRQQISLPLEAPEKETDNDDA